MEVQNNTEARQTINLGEETFYVDSLTEQSKVSFENIKIMDAELKRLETSFNIVVVAKDAMLNKIVADKDNFEKVPTTNAPDAPAPLVAE